MGIVNVTPDSFSDGGHFLSPQAAIDQCLQMIDEGADIIDIGGESTRPGALPVTEEEEKHRVLPVIEKLAAQGAAVSADTMKPAVMRAALSAGAAIINDVSGFTDDAAIAAVAASHCGVIVMHKRGSPQTMQDEPQYDDVVAEVRDFLHDRAAALQNAGVAAARICVDPGIGFGKTVAHNLNLLRALPSLGGDYALMIGISRKSLFATLSGEPIPTKRDAISASAAALLSLRGAHIFRVHNVALTRKALNFAALLSD